MSGKATGIATVLAETLAQAGATSPDGQDELFDPAEYGDDLPGPTKPIAKSGPQGGRPRGARNKSTEQIRAYVLSRYKHPLIVMAEMWSKTPAELAEEMELYELKVTSHGNNMGSSVEKFLATGEAARLQQQALIAALPYLAQKLPIEIAQKGNNRGVLVLGDFKMQVNNLNGGLPLAVDDDAPQVLDVSPLGGDPVE